MKNKKTMFAVMMLVLELVMIKVYFVGIQSFSIKEIIFELLITLIISIVYITVPFIFSKIGKNQKKFSKVNCWNSIIISIVCMIFTVYLVVNGNIVPSLARDLYFVETLTGIIYYLINRDFAVK